jgi:PAS domain S-box-containing protein
MSKENANSGPTFRVIPKPLRVERTLPGNPSSWFETAMSCIGDAVIATDPGARVIFLNPAAEKITGWTHQEAVGKPLQEIFNTVSEQTRATIESPVTKAIRDGAIVGPANHTVLIARDSSEYFIDDSAAPIRDGVTGDITGAVMVFHDTTQRRAIEHKV